MSDTPRTDEINGRIQYNTHCYVEMANFARQLERELQEARKDAERYRWLRDVGNDTWIPLGKRPGVSFTHETDAAIDAARKEGV